MSPPELLHWWLWLCVVRSFFCCTTTLDSDHQHVPNYPVMYTCKSLQQAEKLNHERSLKFDIDQSRNFHAFETFKGETIVCMASTGQQNIQGEILIFSVFWLTTISSLTLWILSFGCWSTFQISDTNIKLLNALFGYSTWGLQKMLKRRQKVPTSSLIIWFRV